jgi:ATP-dependent protease ClpP protease subunit
MAEITLRGEVGIDITLWQIVSELKAIPDNVPVSIRITSEGGSAIEGRDIYHYLKSLNRDITMIADTFVASAAFTIFLGSEKRVAANPQTEFVMHSPMFFGIFIGDDEDMKQIATEIRKEKDLYIDIYSRELGISPEIAEQLMDKDQIIGTDIALKMGIVKEVHSEAAQAYAIAAKSYLNNKHKEILTKNQNEMDNEKLEKQLEENTNKLTEIFDSIKAFFKGKDPEIKALKLATEEGVELEFDTEDLAVGSKVINDAPDGTYKLTYSEKNWEVVIEGGEVKTLTEVVEEELTEDVEALKAENEALKSELEKLKAEQTQASAKFTEFENQMEQMKAIVTPFKQPDGSYKFEAKSMTAEEKDAKKKADLQEFKVKRFGKTEH